MSSLARDVEYTAEDFDRLRKLIRERAGISLSDHKRDLLYSRLRRRIRELGLTSFAEYRQHVDDRLSTELTELINAVTTNYTFFFREAHHFDFLSQTGFPELQRLRSGAKEIRIWSAGCATGEEPYSIAQSARETVRDPAWRVKILATDIDTSALLKADAGMYSEASVRNVEADRLREMFSRAGGQLQIRPELRSMITFRWLNLIEHWPIKRPLDIIVCRNVIIYFEPEMQRKLIQRFTDLLAPGGYLFLGHSESAPQQERMLVGRATTVYQKAMPVSSARRSIPPKHSVPPRKRTRVFVIDDSALVRKMLTEIIGSQPDLEVVGTANDPLVARQRIAELRPDVITLDVEMPKMDGLTFLSLLMQENPTPVLMISSLTERGADVALEALARGAIDFVGKPKTNVAGSLGSYSQEIADKIRAASRADVKKVRADRGSATATPQIVRRNYRLTHGLIGIGASTGGTEAIRFVLRQLPADAPAIVIAQHIPAGFSRAFAERLNADSALSVAEAIDGEPLLPGHAYVAPGGRHLRVVRDGASFRARLDDSEPVNRHRPSVDVLFRSLAEAAGANAIGAILTGMGADGARGLGEMREHGAHTIAQDEESSVVWGMPGEAVRRGSVVTVLPLHAIAAALLQAPS